MDGSIRVPGIDDLQLVTGTRIYLQYSTDILLDLNQADVGIQFGYRTDCM